MFSLLHKENETLLHAYADSPAPIWREKCVCAGEPCKPPAQPPHLQLASRLCSGCALSRDWVLETEVTLELRTKPSAASLAAGRREYPGGRSPDFGRQDLAALELEAFFKSPKLTKTNKQNISQLKAR